VNPASEHFAVTRCGGITTALTHPEAPGSRFGGGGTLIAGQSALINLAGRTPERMKIQTQVALHVRFPESAGGLDNSVRSVTPPEERRRQLEREKEEIQTLRDYFERAKRYAATRSKSPDLAPPDTQLDAMIPYVTG